MPPAYVKAYVKRNKNDAADAEAICEAVTRPTMRFVPIKSADAQSVLMLHRARHLLVRQRTAQVSAMRAHLAEYGVIAPKGRAHVRELVDALTRGTAQVPELARQTLLLIAGMIDALSHQIRTIEIELRTWHRANATCRRLETIPGIGFITATALAATVGDAKVFRSGRQFAAWLGLVPKQHSSGGKERMGGISKRGDRYLRHLLVVGATAVIRYTRRKNDDGQHLGCSAARAQTSKAGQRRRCQQNGTDRLGCHDKRGKLPRRSGYHLRRAERVWAGENDTSDANPVKPGIGRT
jgi:transposase